MFSISFSISDSGVECHSFFEPKLEEDTAGESAGNEAAQESDTSRPSSVADADKRPDSVEVFDDDVEFQPSNPLLRNELLSRSKGGSSSSSSKKQRTAFTPDQISELERRFAQQKYLSASERADFAAKLNLSDTQVCLIV